MKSRFLMPLALSVATMFAAGSVSAQTTTPGVPDTGAGDAFITLSVLGVSSLVALAGATYLYVTREAGTK